VHGGVVGVAIAAALVLSGCGTNVADVAASEAARLRERAESEAAERVGQARERLEGEARERFDDAVREWGGDVDVDAICDMVRDRRLTPAERRTLELVVSNGLQFGVPLPLVQAAEVVVQLNDNATDEQVATMIRACREVGARAMPSVAPTPG
jgi:hypothetical protein